VLGKSLQVRTASFLKVSDSLIGQFIQTSHGDVFFDLPIPIGGVKFGELGAECRQILGGKLP